MDNICEIKECTGCGMCVDICPKNCIKMVYNDEGFIYPEISQECINCGLCRKACPNINRVTFNKIKYAYTAQTKDQKILYSSTSGGIFSELAKPIIMQGGYVFGVEFNSDFSAVKHTCIDSFSEIAKYRGSKYIQSETAGIYKKVKDILMQGKKVLFTGTPCQIAALKAFLGNKEYDNLYTMDFICHGVGSTKVWNDFIDSIMDSRESIEEIKFRDKIKGYNNGFGGNISVKSSNRSYVNPYFKSPFGYAFSRSYINRVSCGKCYYAYIDRVSDITVSDYVGSDNSESDNMNGVSAMFINTDKGKKLFDSVCNNLHFKVRDVNDRDFMSKVPKRLMVGRDSEYNTKRDEVFDFYKKNGYAKTSDEIFKESFFVSCNKKINYIKSVIKKVFRLK